MRLCACSTAATWRRAATWQIPSRAATWHIHSRAATWQIAVHTTFQFGDTAEFAWGKRSRLREKLMWHVDSDSYYARVGGVDKDPRPQARRPPSRAPPIPAPIRRRHSPIHRANPFRSKGPARAPHPRTPTAHSRTTQDRPSESSFKGFVLLDGDVSRVPADLHDWAEAAGSLKLEGYHEFVERTLGARGDVHKLSAGNPNRRRLQ